MKTVHSLLKWYDRHKRDLPWRHTSDPYAIWLSEVILQQTRVDQGMAYYHAFLDRFPTVTHLANASQEEVMRLWQGLGYYSRARNLHATAQYVRDHCGGQFPGSYDALLALRGIGPYTAAAIASFAFGENKAVVDGNVTRVLGRLFAIDDAADSTSGKRVFQEAADLLIPAGEPALFNQAIMEFGALQCTPRQPQCGICPLRTDCSAYASDRVMEFPVKGRKTQVKQLWYYYFVPDNGRSTWMRKRSHNGIWKGLYDFPCIESDVPLTAAKVKARAATELALPLPVGFSKGAKELVHILSHRKIHATFYRLSDIRMWKNKPAEYREVKWQDLDGMGISRLADRFLES